MTEPTTGQDLTSKRVAHNQSTFRAANEGIQSAAREIGADFPRVPFICECPKTSCTQVMRLSFDEYEAVRADGAHFAVSAGHEVCVVDGTEVARIVERRDGHTVMEKVNAAGAEARRLDPRSGSVR